MRKLILFILLTIVVFPIDTKAEKWSKKDQQYWLNYTENECPANISRKSKTDRRFKAILQIAKDNNIKDIEKNIIIPSFKMYCDCLAILTKIDTDNHMEYLKNNCVPLVQNELRKEQKQKYI